MIILGLTGSIGMGKTTVASQLKLLGAEVICADAIVHDLLAKNGGAVEAVGRAFSGVVKAGAVDRKALGEIVFKDKAKLKQLEEIMHPLVVAEENRQIEIARRHDASLVVLDIPLLYETGAEKRCDLVLVADAPGFIQRQRVMKRPNMTEAKLNAILASQMPQREKCARADAVIHTGLGKAFSFRLLESFVRGLQ